MQKFRLSPQEAFFHGPFDAIRQVHWLICRSLSGEAMFSACMCKNWLFAVLENGCLGADSGTKCNPCRDVLRRRIIIHVLY